MISEQELQEIEARADAATIGPWIYSPNAMPEIRFRSDNLVIGICAMEVPAVSFRHENGQFIAHARTDVPVLVAEVRRLREALKEIAEIASLDYLSEECHIAMRALDGDK